MIKRMSLLSLIILSLGVVSWRPSTSLASGNPQTVMEKPAMQQNEKDASTSADGKIQPTPGFLAGGTAVFSPNGTYDCAGNMYTFKITGAPPNDCGTLHIIRNDINEVTPNWVCTDANGSATKGPWTVSTNQTGKDIYVIWSDGSQTAPKRTKVDDITPPTIWIGSISPTFSGGASDTRYGSGFGSWTNVYVTLKDTTTNLYWNGSCYCFSTPPSPPIKATPTISSDGYSLTWSYSAPPRDPSHTYKWTVVTNDHCFESNKASTP